jgi:hypothetical protein
MDSRIYLFPETVHTGSGVIQLLVRWVSVFLSTVKGPERKVDLLPPPDTEVSNQWSKQRLYSSYIFNFMYAVTWNYACSGTQTHYLDDDDDDDASDDSNNLPAVSHDRILVMYR